MLRISIKFVKKKKKKLYRSFDAKNSFRLTNDEDISRSTKRYDYFCTPFRNTYPSAILMFVLNIIQTVLLTQVCPPCSTVITVPTYVLLHKTLAEQSNVSILLQ
jgi:hypothetical protein